MARRFTRSTSRRAAGRSYGSRGRGNGRSNYRSRSGSSRRSVGSRRSSGTRTIRIEVVQPSVNPVARPMIGQKPADAPRKAMF